MIMHYFHKVTIIGLIPILSTITGCATQGIKVETQEVKVPVPVLCKTPTPDKPQYQFPTLTQDDDIFTKVKVLLSDRKLSLGYEIELAAALTSCKE